MYTLCIQKVIIKQIVWRKFLGDVFVIILGGSYSVVSNYESNINVQSNENVSSIANKTIMNLLK